MALTTTVAHEQPRTSFVIAPDDIDRAFWAAVSPSTVPSTWDVVRARDYIAAPATDPRRAVILVPALVGPMPSTKEAVLLLVQSGVRDIAIALYHPSPVDDDDELPYLVEMEVLALLDAYGFPNETTLVVHLRPRVQWDPAALWRGFRGILYYMSGEGSLADEADFTYEVSSLGSTDMSLDESDVGLVETGFNLSELEQLDRASLSVIASAPGRRVRDGHATALAANVQGGWWAPEFQFVRGTRGVDPEVIDISDSLGGREDVVGVLSWWLTTNAWLNGARPCNLVGTGRGADLRFAAAQVSAGDW